MERVARKSPPKKGGKDKGRISKPKPPKVGTIAGVRG